MALDWQTGVGVGSGMATESVRIRITSRVSVLTLKKAEQGTFLFGQYFFGSF